MSIASTFKTVLSQSAPLTELVGIAIAENAMEPGPTALVVFDVTETPDTTLSGQTGCIEASISAQCWAYRSEEARAIADAVADRIAAFDASQSAVCATVIGRSSAYEPELKMNCITLSIEWWQQ